MKNRLPRKIKKQIPVGMYCYEFTGETSQVWNEEFKSYVTSYKTRCCPFYFVNILGFGDCKYSFSKNDELNGETDVDVCLDDQCKCCNFSLNYKK